MRDQDRADKLAKAIEEMVQGRTPENLDDDELAELLAVAKIRLDAARLAAQAGSEVQSVVLERLIARLNLRRKKNPGDPVYGAKEEGRSGSSAPARADPDGLDDEGLQDVIALRRRMAEHAAAISEQHREAVWQRIEARIKAEQSTKRRSLRLPFRRGDAEADEFCAALDRMILGEPLWEAPDSNLEELLRVARLRQVSAETTRDRFVHRGARVWDRLRPRLIDRRERVFKPKVFAFRPKLAAVGAVAALALAVLGPIPATGLAQHPIAEFARFLGGHVGVRETSAPAAIPPVTQVIEGNDASTLEASSFIGLPVYEPAFLPTGYAEVSSRYFPEPITAEEGGVFILTYESASPAGSVESISVYQERSSATSIAVERGFAQDILLSTGTPATYVKGTWQASGADLTWGTDDGQAIIFDHDGLRTIVQATGAGLPLMELMAMASSLAGQATPP